MTPDALRELIDGGETSSVEFKGEERASLGDRDLVEAIVCLANRIGAAPAHLLIGVEDDGRITDPRPRHGETTDPARIATLIANRTRPSIAVRAESVTIDRKLVLVVEMPAQRHPVATSEGLFLRRTPGGDGRPACVPMNGYAVQSLQSDRGLLDPSAQIVAEARWEPLDPLEFERFRRSVRERRGRSDESLIDLPDLDLAKALGVVDANGSVRGVRLAALLLFAKEDALQRFIPTHEVAFQVLRGLDVEINDFFRWPLLRVMEECEARVRARNREQELMVGLLRVGVPDYPERALREALANALIHRDYQRLGAVHFQWHTDQIEITSPGGFPEGVRLDNLLVTAPRPRNPLLADAFKRAGNVERTARGIDTIFFEQLRNGRPAPSYARSNEATVSVVVPGGAANLDFVRLLVTEAQQGRDLALDELLILNTLWQTRSVTTDDAARLVQKPKVKTRAALHRMVEAGLVGGARPETGPELAPLRGDVPAARRQGWLRTPARVRAPAAGTDGVAVRGKARPDHAARSGGVVPHRVPPGPRSARPPLRPRRAGHAGSRKGRVLRAWRQKYGVLHIDSRNLQKGARPGGGSMRLLFTCAANSVSRSDRCVLQPSASTVDSGRQCTANARVHSSMRRVHFAVGAACRRGEAACLPKAWRRQARLDAAIAANLKELGYGG